MNCEIWFDGASRGNPGASGAGALLRVESVEIPLRRALGRKTCNEAEYEALILGLKEALNRGVTHVRVFGDSKLVINQVSGRWKVRAGHLRHYYVRAAALCAEFERVSLRWIPREKNADADRLSNEAIDGARALRIKPRKRTHHEPLPTEERIIDGQAVKVTLCPPRIADGASRQTFGRLHNKMRGA